jgi:hypothetical protein
VEGKVDNNRKDDGTDNAGGRCAEVDYDHCEGSRGEGNDANDDGGLSYGLSLNFEGKFHPPSNEKGEIECQGLKEKCWKGARARGWNPRIVLTAELRQRHLHGSWCGLTT